jgi:hypothetical protein
MFLAANTSVDDARRKARDNPCVLSPKSAIFVTVNLSKSIQSLEPRDPFITGAERGRLKLDIDENAGEMCVVVSLHVVNINEYSEYAPVLYIT